MEFAGWIWISLCLGMAASLVARDAQSIPELTEEEVVAYAPHEIFEYSFIQQFYDAYGAFEGTDLFSFDAFVFFLKAGSLGKLRLIVRAPDGTILLKTDDGVIPNLSKLFPDKQVGDASVLCSHPICRLSFNPAFRLRTPKALRVSYDGLGRGVEQVNGWVDYARRAFDLGHYPRLNTVVVAYTQPGRYMAVIEAGAIRKRFRSKGGRYIFIPVRTSWLNRGAIVELSKLPVAAFPFNRVPALPIATEANLRKIYRESGKPFDSAQGR